MKEPKDRWITEHFFEDELVRKAVLTRLEDIHGDAFWNGAARFLAGAGFKVLRPRFPRLNGAELLEVTLPQGCTLQSIIWDAIYDAGRYWKVPRNTPNELKPNEAFRLAFMAFARKILWQRLRRCLKKTIDVPLELNDDIIADQQQRHLDPPENDPRVAELASKLKRFSVCIVDEPENELLYAVMRVVQQKDDQILLAILQLQVWHGPLKPRELDPLLKIPRAKIFEANRRLAKFTKPIADRLMHGEDLDPECIYSEMITLDPCLGCKARRDGVCCLEEVSA